MRTTETAITFRRPFVLTTLDSAQPAGTYRIVIEEEEIPGLSFVAKARALVRVPVARVRFRARSW